MNDDIRDRKIWMEFEPLEGQPFSINKTSDIENLRIDFSVIKDVRFDPNTAQIQVYGLSDAHSNSLSLRFDIGQALYGATVRLYAGYLGNSSVRLLFEGNIAKAETDDSGEGLDVTYIRAMHLIRNIAGGTVSRTFVKGEKVSAAMEELAKAHGKKISAKQKAYIDSKLGDKSVFKKKESIEGSTQEVHKMFSDRFKKELYIYFDESGPQFLKVGESNGDDPVLLSKHSGLEGRPQITEIGANITCRMNTKIRNGTPVHLKSRVTSSLTPKKEFAVYIAEKIVHRGSNYEGNFSTEIKGLYEGGPLSQVRK